VDDESWPVESRKFPNFSASGAYSPQQTYSLSDVQLLINYAAERGILLIAEFDVPAHCTIWGAGTHLILTKARY
jgi:hexosaminidase